MFKETVYFVIKYLKWEKCDSFLLASFVKYPWCRKKKTMRLHISTNSATNSWGTSWFYREHLIVGQIAQSVCSACARQTRGRGFESDSGEISKLPKLQKLGRVN